MKAAVFYFTQSGQAFEVAKSICHPMENDDENCLEHAPNQVKYKEIKPRHKFPFPWSKQMFFDTFPETRLGMPYGGIEEIDFTDIEDADVVMIVGQSWFLSPSLPLQSFFNDEAVRRYLKGRDVVFVNACRNMWLMTGRRIKELTTDIGARLVGHIVLQDKAPNLISAVTVVRWMMHGRKQKTRFLPAAGISETDKREASCFGEIILKAWSDGSLSNLQEQLLGAGAINYKPTIMYMEQLGHRMFGHWAKFIRRKGGPGDERRQLRVRLFEAYLYVVLFLLSPIGALLFCLTWPFHHVNSHRKVDCSV